MRHTSRKRSAPDPLAPITAPTWLAVRNRLGFVIESIELTPGADLRAVLTAARDTRTATGWAAEPIGPSCGFFFASRDGERILVGIERQIPRSPLGNGTSHV